MPPRKRRRRDASPVAGLVDRYREAPRGQVTREAPAGPLAALQEAWRAVAGREAHDSTPIRWSRGGILTVACSDASVAQALAARSDDLVDGLSHRAGVAVRGIRPVIADHAVVRDATPSEPAPPVTPGPQAVAAAEGLAAAIDDPDLRALVARAAAAALQRNWDE